MYLVNNKGFKLDKSKKKMGINLKKIGKVFGFVFIFAVFSFFLNLLLIRFHVIPGGYFGGALIATTILLLSVLIKFLLK